MFDLRPPLFSRLPVATVPSDALVITVTIAVICTQSLLARLDHALLL